MLRTPNLKPVKGLDDLLGGRLIAQLSRLDVTSRKIFTGKLKGERRTKRKGDSVEFADHRPYVSGDDLRRLDWNLYGRLDRLFLKLFMEEEDLSVHIVVDASESMDCGEPNKFRFAQQAAASLAYIGLHNLHRVTLTAMSARMVENKDGESEDTPGGILTVMRNLRGTRRARDMGDWLCQITPGGSTSFTESAKRIALTRQGRGVMVIISDFFMKEGYEPGLRLLVGHGYDIIAIQVLSPQEVSPDIAGDLRLKDVEDADMADVTISAPLIKRYKANLTAYCDQLRSFCARREIMHMTVQSDLEPEKLVMDYLRSRGVLR